MEISEFEKFIIRRYAFAELTGALALGKMSRKTNDPYLREKLVWHCYEEARHAVVWNDLMAELGIEITPVEGDEEDLISYYEDQMTLIDKLVFTHLYELRVPFHFRMHLEWTKNPRVQAVLKQLIKEEGPHLSWIRDYLKKEQENGSDEVKKSLLKYYEIEKNIYLDDLNKIKNAFGQESNEFVTSILNVLEQENKRVLKAISF